MLVSNVHFNRCSMATVSDQTNEVNYSWCTWRDVRANCAYLLSGGVAVNFFGGFMTDCDDQGISCYATNLKVIGMSFFNVANRPIALRNTALDRVVVQGCTFKHKETVNFPDMMPIGYPGGAFTSIKNVDISGNIFDIDVLNYYIAQVGNITGLTNLCNNTIRIGRCVAGTSNFIFWYESTEDFKPNIDGNRIHNESNDEVSLCRTTQPVALGRNIITPIAKQDGSSPAVKTPNSPYEIFNSNLNSFVGSNRSDIPKGNFHINCQEEMLSNIKEDFGVWWSASSDSSNFSVYDPYTIGGFGVAWGNPDNQDSTDNYFGVVMPNPSTGNMEIVSKIDAKGDLAINTITASGDIDTDGYVKSAGVLVDQDFKSQGNGYGLILTTPDGSKTYRLSVNNAGQLQINLV